MNTRDTTRRTNTRSLTGTALVGLLLTGSLATAAPAGASLPREHDTRADRTPSTLVLVNGVHTMAGVTAKLARLPQHVPPPSDVVSSQAADVPRRSC